MSASATITAAFKQQFHDSYVLALQQMVSRFQGTVVDRGMIQGSSFTINNTGLVEAREVTGRYQDKTAQNPDNATRIVYMSDYDIGPIPVDSFDKLKLSADPTSSYVQMLLGASNRRKDKTIYRALLDGVFAKTSEGGTPTLATIPAGQQIAAGGTGLTKAKVIQAKALFRKNKADAIDNPGTKLYIAYNSDSVRQILSDTTLTSADFLAARMLENGDLVNWCGFEWIPYEDLDVPAANTARTVAWSSAAVQYGLGMEIKSDVSENKSKRGHPTEVYGWLSLGAGRQDESKVVQIDFATNV